MSKQWMIFFPLLAPLLLFSYNFNPSTFTNPQTTHKSLHIYQRTQTQTAESACGGTFYPDLCVSTVSTLPELRQKTLPEVIAHTIDVTVREVKDSASNCSGLRRKLQKRLEPIELRALDDCLELFSTTVSDMNKILADLSSAAAPAGGGTSQKHYDDMVTLLSGGMTNQYTCLDGFSFSKNNTRTLIEGRLKRISKLFSNSLAMVKKLKKRSMKKPKNGTATTADETTAYEVRDDGYPTWLTRKDRRLLQASVNQTRFDLVVAKDGSGNYTKINDALSAAPNNSNTRFVIYIKAGAYYEYVEVVSKKTMIMFVGDGIGKTLIKGNRSVIDGWTTFRSATVAVVGTGFLAKGITFENYAGPDKHQAVALRSGSDFSAFYKCSFIGYQDTLYAHTLRQFYRECDIYGTIDFIFGNAAVVFQNSNLYARKPNSNQQNIFTAQGREDPNQNTGISILNCKVSAASDLIPVLTQFKTYLGRPWKEYSRTVYMYSNMESVVAPKGWLEWDGNSSLSNLYYGEYQNRGPGSNTSARVKWPGYRVINNSIEASQFTVANFIQGNQWLPSAGIPFYPNLTAT